MIKGFKMKLYEGQEAEYERRHNLLWPEMKDMIHEHGGKNYTIFLDREPLTLFGSIEIEDEEVPLADLPQTGQLWWPVPFLALGGMFFLLIGALRRRGDEYGEE